jgi:starch synthase
MYDDVPGASYIGSTSIWLAGFHHEVAYFHKFEEEEDGLGADFVFVSHGCYRRPGGLYHNAKLGVEYEDNLFRFGLLSLAALEAPLVLRPRGLYLGEKVLFIANDWQSALVPVYLAYKYRQPNPNKPKGTYSDSRCIYVTHNMGYQGQYPESRFPIGPFLGLPEVAHGELRFHDCINLAKGAIITADRVVTVSPAYASEIQTLHGGFGLDGFLRAKGDQLRLVGILNGIDDGWDPATDPHIQQSYSLDTVAEGKAACKSALQSSLGLNVEPGTLLLGFVGRLAWQKGIDLIESVAPWLLDSRGKWPVQLIMMGHGDREYTEFLQWAEATYVGQVCGYAGFSPIVEHHMIAGCDVLLMPSRYEPCGLPQMYALQYGTLPVVHATGGLKDSVLDGQTGFHFSPFEAGSFRHALYRAMETYYIDQPMWRSMQSAAMKSDFYWPRAIDEYEQHIDYTFDTPPAIYVEPLPVKPLIPRLRAKRGKEPSCAAVLAPTKGSLCEAQSLSADLSAQTPQPLLHTSVCS